MNKILLGTIFLFIIIGLFLLILFTSKSPFGKSNSSFATEPKEEITKIEFSESGKRLTLEKKGDSWIVNGKSEARKNGILFILRILKEIKIKSPLSPELFKSEITVKNVIPVKVKVYEKRSLLRTFLVYKTESNTYGNVMKVKETSKPYIVYLPGYEGDIGSGFTLNELFWQPYTIFDLLPSEIASVNFENLTDTASSFLIISRNHHNSLSGSAVNNSRYDSSLLARYISYFAWVPFESWAFKIGEADRKTIEAQKPLYRITVNGTTGKKSVLTLWGMLTDRNGTKTLDTDRLLGKTDERDELFILRYFDIDPLIKKRDYFFQR